MTGKQLFEQQTAVYNEYSGFLLSLHTILGEASLFDLLEQAEKNGKKLALDESAVPADKLDDDIDIDTIIFV